MPVTKALLWARQASRTAATNWANRAAVNSEPQAPSEHPNGPQNLTKELFVGTDLSEIFHPGPGRICCFVRDRANVRYLLTSHHVLDPERPGNWIQGNTLGMVVSPSNLLSDVGVPNDDWTEEQWDADWNNRLSRHIADIITSDQKEAPNWVKSGTGSNRIDVLIAKLLPGVFGNNTSPDGVVLKPPPDISAQPAINDPVKRYNSEKGWSNATIVEELEYAWKISPTAPLNPATWQNQGDSGSPVVDQYNRLIGIAGGAVNINGPGDPALMGAVVTKISVCLSRLDVTFDNSGMLSR
ncbi:hypothetical protein AB833_26665 [Chromatiales bacterium (ex Bugula neritina AB1)]|nr:hypothetical protein AB833_26665 [Chromatiales bacterium (ex Bugula neritina AB1)]